MADSLGPVPDPAVIILRIGRREQVVELSDRNIASIVGLNDSSTRAVRTGTLRGGGVADDNA